MNEPLKQRLVGAGVLLGLAVIFLPPLVDRSTPAKKSVKVIIPAQPKITVRHHLNVLKLPPAIVVANEKKKVVTKQPILVKPTREKVKTTTVAVTSKALVVAKEKTDLAVWVVQLASFKSKDNAYKLRDKLRKKKYDAFVQRVLIDKRTLYRVRVGPELKRESAEKILKRLQAETQLKGVIKKHSRS